MHPERLNTSRVLAFGLPWALALCLVSRPTHSGDEGFYPTGAQVSVRPSAPAVVHIPSGTFTSGSDLEERARARALCAAEMGPSPSPLVLRACLGETHGCAPSVFNAEEPSRTRWLHAFALDRTEVTQWRYGRCVRAGVCPEAMVREGDPQYGEPEQPAVGLSWDDAERYCHWVGGRLPTGAEWERGARGRDGRVFPWGAQADPRRMNHGALALGCLDPSDGHNLTSVVGSYPEGASPEGLLDMAGNVSEWVSDRYEIQGVVTVGSSERTLRGGSYRLPRHCMRAASRGHSPAGQRALDVGFRCAYDDA